MALALDEPKESDHSKELEGVTYLLDEKLAEKIGSVNVDYVEQGWRSGFVIKTEKPLGFQKPDCGPGCAC